MRYISLILTTSFLVAAIAVSAQSPNKLDYGVNFGGQGNVMDVDAQGNAYVAGTFEGSESFGSFTLNTNGQEDVFVIKISPTGTILKAVNFGGDLSERIAGIDVDNNGNVHLVGSFSGHVDFDPGPGNVGIEPFDDYDGYLLKLNTNLEYVWMATVGGFAYNEISGVATDASSNVYITGTFDTDAEIGYTNTSAEIISDNQSAFFAKLNSSGQRGWEKALGNDNLARGTAATVDAAGNPVFAGYHAGTILLNYDLGTDSHTSSSEDVFLIKANPANGNYIWGRAFGSNEGTYTESIFADPQNNIYVSGYFGGSGDFDPGTGTKTFFSAGDQDMFVSKFNSSGTLTWAQQHGSTAYDWAHDIYATATDVYVTGVFSEDLDFGNLYTEGNLDGFILNLDNNGNYKWSAQLGGTDGAEDLAYNVAGVSGNIFINGRNNSRPNDVDPSCQSLNLDPETAPSYVIKIGTSPSDCLTITKQPVGVDVCAGETVVLTVEATGTGINYQWFMYDSDGGYQEVEDAQGYYSGSKTSTLTINTGNDDKGENTYVVALTRGIEEVYSEEAYVNVGPDSPYVNDIINCGSGSVTITANGGLNGQYRWYTVATGGTAIAGATGGLYTTPVLTNTTSYWVSINDGTCESQRKVVVVNITSCEQAPAMKWAKTIGGPLTDTGGELIVLKDGNLLIPGMFQGTVDFDPGPNVLNLTADQQDGYLMKMTPDGALIWVKQFTGNNSHPQPSFVHEDPNGDLYLSGTLFGAGPTDFDGGTGTLNVTSSGNQYPDGFIVKFDKDGNPLWGKKMGNTPYFDGITDMAVDASGVYLTGYFFNTFTIDATSITRAGAGGTDIFLLKLSTSGAVSWIKQLGNGFAAGNSVTDAPSALLLNGSDLYLAAAAVNGTTDVDPGAGVVNITSVNRDAYVLKLNTNGEYQSHFAYTSADTDGSSSIIDLDLDDANNMIVSGDFQRTVDFEPGAGTTAITSTGEFGGDALPNGFITKHAPNGTLTWAKAINVINLNQAHGGDITLASNGDMIISGLYQGHVDFDPGPLVHDLNGGSLLFNSFVLKLNSSGEFNWVVGLKRYDNQMSSSANGGVHVVDSNGDIYMTGMMSGRVDFDPGECDYLVQAVGQTDHYLWKLSFDVANICYQIMPESEEICAGEVLSLYAEAVGAPGVTYQWQFSTQAQSGFANISDGNGYAGTKSSELKIDTKAGFGKGFYRAIASAPKAQDITSSVAALTFAGVTPTAPTTISAATCLTSADLLLKAAGGTNGSYLWYDVATGGFPYQGATSDSFQTGTITSTVTYYVAIIDGFCISPRTPVVGSINVGNTAPQGIDGSRCGEGTVTLSALGGIDGQYRWYNAAQGGSAISGQTKSTFTTPLLTTTTSYYVSIALNDCESPRAEVVANVNSLRTIINMSTKGCNGLPATLNAPAGAGDVYWYADANGTTLLQIGNSFTTPQLQGNTTYYFKNVAGNCVSIIAKWDIEATNCADNKPPVIEAVKRSANVGKIFELDLLEIISDPDNNLDLSTLKIISQPISQAPAELDGTILRIDYTGSTFTKDDKVVIEACDIAGVCVQQTVTIAVSAKIVVYNAISPNDDGKNEILFIEFIDSFDDTKTNKVSIYNRWGDLVFEVNDYNNTTNVFKGKNKSGNDLASGTYFYKIEFDSKRKTETGYLSLKR